MTQTDPRLAHDRILSRDDDIQEVLELLLQNALNPRQVWLVFLDDADRVAGPLMPCDDYPEDPNDPADTDDLGRIGFADLLAARLAGMLEAIEAAQVVFVWERRGPSEFLSDELAWASAMARSCAGAGVRVRAQFLLHTSGVRPLTLDDHG